MKKSDISHKAKDLLRSANLNCTRSQILILEKLLQVSRPLSRDEIIKTLGKSSPDQATVYRVLKRFCEKGIIHKAYLQSRAWKYELAHNCTETQCHPHFTCTGCGKTFCLKNSFLPLIKNLEKGFVFHRQQVRVEGLCSMCS
ncbi:MAG: transcriptional repressor [Sedimentisphaerales bacterium]|nr:transcriptional repressor [Sedimentisphaerales bacterium]